MSEDKDRSTVDKEQQLEAYAKMLGEAPKRRNLPEMSKDKKELVERILHYRNLKNDFTLSKARRIEIENLSFECYERILALCDGDTDLVCRLLGERKPTREKTEDVLEP
jgi:hypothetical protein